MGIDGVGKKGATPTPGASGAQQAANSAGVAKPFAAHMDPAAASGPEAAAAAPATSASEPLARVRAGEIDVREYIDLKIEAATAKLRGLPPADLEAIKEALRAEISADPSLVDLVQASAGAAPPASPED